jgi:CysZ protein
MIRDTISGIQAYGRALALTREMKLGSYFLIPALISILLAVVIFSAAIGYSDNIGEWVSGLIPFESWRGVLGTVASWLAGILIIALALLLYKHLVMILSSPFMSLLSEKVEKKMLQDRYVEVPFNLRKAVRDIIRGIRISLRLIFRELLLVLLLFLLSFIPGVGLITTVLIFLVQAYFAGFGNMDFTLERHFSVSGSVGFVRANKGIALGNGIVFLLILMTVVGFLVVLPLSTISSTYETVKRLEEKEVI